MKFLVLALILFSIPGFAQITGNLQVKDSSALVLDAQAVKMLQGKWKLLKSVEFLRGQEHLTPRGEIVAFEETGTIITSWCNSCFEEKTGQWQVVGQQAIKFEDNRPDESKHLAGEWVVYKLTAEELVLAKVLTSRGDWKKFHYFSRKIGNPPATAADRYCINCKGKDGTLCLGDRPEEANRQMLVVHEAVNMDSVNLQNPVKTREAIDWLLTNAPCLHHYFYVQAITFYEKLLSAEDNGQTKAFYEQKLKAIKAQQNQHFAK